jgi:hypothetical protein
MLEVHFDVARGYCRRSINPNNSRGTTPSPSEEIRASAQETASGALTTISL